MQTPVERASNPKQYDETAQAWHKAAAIEKSPRNEMILAYLERYLRSWRGKRFLDIGSGTGWVLNVAKGMQSERAVGIEPSALHASLSKKNFPDIEVHNIPFQDYVPATDERYEKAVSIWTLTHIEDVDAFFEKVALLLEERGEFLAIVPDFTYYRQPRHDYQMELQDLNEDSYVVEVVREKEGTIADIVRKPKVYIEAAARAGLECVEEVGMYPTEALMQRSPKYKEYEHTPISQLLRFKKRAS